MEKEGWVKKKLGDLGKVITGSTPSTKDVDNYSSYDYCFVKPSDIAKDGITNIISTENYISHKAYEASRKIPRGSILTTCIGIIGKVGINQSDCLCNQQINAIIPNDLVLNKFLAYSIYYQRDLLTQKANAPVVPIINKKDFSDVKILIPPLPEQQQIVSELDCLQGIIEKKKEQLQELDKLAQSIFYTMFGDFENQKWVRLIDLYKFIDYRGKTPNKIDKGIPLITAKNVRFGYIDYSIKEYISESEYQNRQTRGVSHKGDLLFTTEAPLGYCAVADLDVFSTGQRLIAFQKLDEDINNIFYLYYLMSDKFQYELQREATGSTAQGIKASKLKELKVPIVDYKKQQTFADKITAIEQQKARIQQSLQDTETLFNSRMDYYFG